MKSSRTHLLVAVLFLTACGGEETPELKQATTPASATTEGSLDYQVLNLIPALETAVEISEPGLYQVTGEARLYSEDYCKITADVQIQQPGSGSWRTVRRLKYRGSEGSTSLVSEDFTLILPMGGKFRITNVLQTKSTSFPDADCGIDFAEGTMIWTAYRIR